MELADGCRSCGCLKEIADQIVRSWTRPASTVLEHGLHLPYRPAFAGGYHAHELGIPIWLSTSRLAPPTDILRTKQSIPEPSNEIVPALMTFWLWVSRFVLRFANEHEDAGGEGPNTDAVGPDGWHYQLVKIYSGLEQGTTIKLYLPRSTEPEDKLVQVESGPVEGGRESILVVEDDEEVRDTTIATP
jgi:hypothetical protein